MADREQRGPEDFWGLRCRLTVDWSGGASAVSRSGRNGPLFRDVQDRIEELADVLRVGNGMEASAGRVADEELGAIREDAYSMGAERHVYTHAEGGIVVA